MIYDLHTHTTFSDGVLNPAELVQRARDKGYGGIAITDHADISNLKFIIESLRTFEESINKGWDDIKVLTGVELTHIPPKQIPYFIKLAREYGAGIVVVHGETPTEPVPEGTNHAAIVGGADLLAHPGLITSADVKLAAKKNIFIEITARNGHNRTNGHVANLVKKHKAPFVFDTDTHLPDNLFTKELLNNVALGAGFSKSQLVSSQNRSKEFIVERLKR